MNAIAPRHSAPASRAPVLTPQTFDQLMTFAEMAATSELVPKDYKGKPANIVIAVQMGSELGLQPMQSLSSIAVINGRPGVWGDGLIGLCRQSPLCEDIREWFEGEGETRVAHCEAKRRGASPTTAKFSVADAKKASLWGKNIWQQYPDRMLQARARGFALRDAFPDLLRGLKTVEELQDYQREERAVQSVELRPEPRPQVAPVRSAPQISARPLDAVLDNDQIPDFDAPPPPQPSPLEKATLWLQPILDRLSAASDQDAYNLVMQTPKLRPGLQAIERDFPTLYAQYEEARASAMERIVPKHEPQYEYESPTDSEAA